MQQSIWNYDKMENSNVGKNTTNYRIWLNEFTSAARCKNNL